MTICPEGQMLMTTWVRFVFLFEMCWTNWNIKTFCSKMLCWHICVQIPLRPSFWKFKMADMEYVFDLSLLIIIIETNKCYFYDFHVNISNGDIKIVTTVCHIIFITHILLQRVCHMYNTYTNSMPYCITHIPTPNWL